MKIIKVPLNAGALSKKQGQEKAPKAVAEEIKSFYMKEAGILPFLDYENVDIPIPWLEGKRLQFLFG